LENTYEYENVLDWQVLTTGIAAPSIGVVLFTFGSLSVVHLAMYDISPMNPTFDFPEIHLL